ncbi:MAG: Wzt carbohydrate-binding domain-containing protein, partial [Methylobacter sp.]
PQEVVRRYSDFLLGNIGETKAESIVAATTPPSPQGHARLSHIEVSLDGTIDRVFHGRPGENNLSIRLQFESDPTLPAPTVGITLNYGTLMTVTSVLSHSENVLIERNEQGRGEVTVDFPALPLRKGEFHVAVYLCSEDALHIYDSAPNVATLHIKDSLPEPGLVKLKHRWHTQAFD